MGAGLILRGSLSRAGARRSGRVAVYDLHRRSGMTYAQQPAVREGDGLYTDTPSEAQLNAVAAHSEMIELLGGMFHQELRDVPTRVELALLITRRLTRPEVERLARVGTGSPGVKARLCAPGHCLAGRCGTVVGVT